MKNTSPLISDYQNALILLVRERFPSFLLGLLITSYFSVFIINKIGIRKDTAQVRIEKKSDLDSVKTYTVKLNDDLWGIAEKMYGSGFNAVDIAVANKLAEPYMLTENQILIIPDISPKKPTQGQVTNEAAQTKRVTQYTVVAGDYLYQIAEKVYGDGNLMNKLIEKNNIPYPYNVEEGQVLLIP